MQTIESPMCGLPSASTDENIRSQVTISYRDRSDNRDRLDERYCQHRQDQSYHENLQSLS